MFQRWGEVNLSRLARESGVSYSQVSKIVNGRTALTPYQAGRLGPSLGVTAENLLEGTERVTVELLVRRLESIEEKLDEILGSQGDVLTLLRRRRSRRESAGGVPEVIQ